MYKLLKPYVEAKARRVIQEKEEAGIRPALATELEIVEDIRKDILNCMNDLHRGGVFRIVDTLNVPALIKE